MPSGESCGAGAAVERIRSGRSFGKRVGADNFSGSEPRQIFFLLLLRAKINDGQRSDPGVTTPGGSEASVFGDVVGYDGGSDFVHFQTAISFGNFGTS